MMSSSFSILSNHIPRLASRSLFFNKLVTLEKYFEFLLLFTIYLFTLLVFVICSWLIMQ